MDPGDVEGFGDFGPPLEEQVAEVTIEDADTTPATGTSQAVGEQALNDRIYTMELEALRDQYAQQGVDPDELLRMNEEVVRSGREWSPMPTAERYALDRLVELSTWSTARLEEVEEAAAAAAEAAAAASVHASDDSSEEGVAPLGQSSARPSLVATPGGRQELRQSLMAAIRRGRVTGSGGAGTPPSGVALTIGTSTATSAAPPTTQGAPSGSSGAAPAVAAPPVAPSAALPAAPSVAPPVAPRAAPTAAPTAPMTAPAPTTATNPVSNAARASAATVGSVGFRPMGSGVRSGYSTTPTAATTAATSQAAQAPYQTPRGAIPSYGGMTFGWTPQAAVSAPVSVGPSYTAPPVTPSNAPVGTVSSRGVTPRAGLPSVSAWFPPFNASTIVGKFQPAVSRPTPATVPPTPTNTFYGSGAPYGFQANPASTSPVSPGSAGWGTVPPSTTGPVGLRSSVKNAVDMIYPFYSDGSTVERARTFWAEFERITRGMDDDLRMTVFRRCLKGKTGEDWWSHSRISDFDTLRVRFHNRFMCISPPQMMERLRTTKRSRGESVEEWADRIRDLCDEASLFDPLMRYQYFLAGIRNSAWTAALQTTMVNSIEEAVTVLLFKNMQIPVEKDEDFRDSVPVQTGEQTQLLTLMQQMQSMLAQQQQMMQSPRSPRGRANVAAVQPAMASAAPPQRQFVGIRMSTDQRTQEGVVVCGRCNRMGHGRATCPRQHGTCRKCNLQGHYSMECTVPNGQLPKRNNSGGPPRSGRCMLCKGEGHYMSDCPLVKVLCTVAEREARAMQAAPVTTTAPAQQ